MTQGGPVRRKRGSDIVVPTEHHEQVLVVQWARMNARRWGGATGLLFAVPNGANKSRSAAATFRAEGLRSGVPDLVLPVPRGEHGALFVEMKRLRGGTVSPAQREWIEKLRAAGNAALVCRGHAEAIKAITLYLTEEWTCET